MDRKKGDNAEKIKEVLAAQEPDFGQWLWDTLDDETKDLLELLLAERLSYFSKEREKARGMPRKNRSSSTNGGNCSLGNIQRWRRMGVISWTGWWPAKEGKLRMYTALG